MKPLTRTLRERVDYKLITVKYSLRVTFITPEILKLFKGMPNTVIDGAFYTGTSKLTNTAKITLARTITPELFKAVIDE